MASPRNFLTGFNHNIRHGGLLFHVQTEDSGEDAAVVTTHLFLGGTIIGTRKESYADLRGRPDLREQVRRRMEEQHKQMLRDLVRGVFDEALSAVPEFRPERRAWAGGGGTADGAAPEGPAPQEIQDPSTAPTVRMPALDPALVAAAMRASPPRKPAPVPPPGAKAPVGPGAGLSRPDNRQAPPAGLRPEPAPIPAGSRAGASPARRLASGDAASPIRPPRAPTPPRGFALDPTVAAKLQRSLSQAMQQGNRPPAPPLRDAEARPPVASPPPGRDASAAARPPPSPGLRPPPAGVRSSEPPPLPGAFRPQPRVRLVPSLEPIQPFAEDLISDRSLDEVILAYLAEEEEDEG